MTAMGQRGGGGTGGEGGSAALSCGRRGKLGAEQSAMTIWPRPHLFGNPTCNPIQGFGYWDLHILFTTYLAQSRIWRATRNGL